MCVAHDSKAWRRADPRRVPRTIQAIGTMRASRAIALAGLAVGALALVAALTRLAPPSAGRPDGALSGLPGGERTVPRGAPSEVAGPATSPREEAARAPRAPPALPAPEPCRRGVDPPESRRRA